MLVVLPISNSDAHLTDAVERAFQKFQPGANHNLLVVSSPNAKDQARDLLNKLQKYFVNATNEVFNTNHSLDWPRACNFYFQQTCYLVPKYTKPTQGWLWMEMDSVPLTKNWLDYLEQQYYADNQLAAQQGRQMYRFMGAQEKTIKSFGGELDNGQGFHMASVGIYPADMVARCPVLNSLPSVNTHFSTHIKWYSTVCKGNPALHVTPLIQNNRETGNYRFEEGRIVCDGIARNAFDVQFNEPLSEGAVLLHGCKDGSLIDLVPEDRAIKAIIRQDAKPPQRAERKPYFNPPPFQVEIPTPEAEVKPVQQTVQMEVQGPTLPPVARKFGDHATLQASKPAVQFDETTGLAIQPPSPPVFSTPPIVAPESPSAPQVPESSDVAPKQPKKKAKKRLNLSPEERRRRSLHAKKLAEARRNKVIPIAA